MEAVRGLALRQPSLLSRATDGLQAKVDAYGDLFAPDTGVVSCCWCCCCC
jgi:hypothetical protein